ncbi:MAG: GSU2403 family nucleotidyltransferase fold protein [bacterium]
MNDLEDELSSILDALGRNGLLKHLVLIGSWVMVVYEAYFRDSNYSPSIRTTDVDFLIPKRHPRIDGKKDVSRILEALGFSEVFSSDGWCTYHKPELHVEFLLPRIGPQSDDVVSIPSLGLNARPLRHLSLLADNIIAINFQGFDITVPHPAAYALQKLIISARRKISEKAQKDIDQAEAVLTVLKKRSDIELLRTLFEQLTKKQRKAVLDSAKKRVFLDDVLKKLLENE